MRVSILLLFVCSCSHENSVAVSYGRDSLSERKPARIISNAADISKSQSTAEKETKPSDSKSKEAIPEGPAENKEATVKEEDKEQTSGKSASEHHESAAEKKLSDIVANLELDRAATKEEVAVEEELMTEITGLIIEQTMTKVGYDFYEYFYMLWEPPPEAAGREFNIYISERASPMWGSWVDVSIDDTVVWSSVLQPRSVEIEDAVAEAIMVVQQYFQDFQEDQGQIEEMVGTGI